MALDRRIRLPIRGGRGTRVVHNHELKTFTCPACGGTGKKELGELEPMRLHSERAWQCRLCGGPGQITCTETTYKDLTQHFDAKSKVYFMGSGAN